MLLNGAPKWGRRPVAVQAQMTPRPLRDAQSVWGQLMFAVRLLATAAAMALAASGAQAAATLTHAYDFSSTRVDGGSAYVVDLQGAADGLLLNGASVAGGLLSLDGVNDYVQFGEKIVATGGPFSVFARAEFQPNLSGITELISQGFSGGPGFYFGENGGGGFRLGDATGGAPPVPAVGGFHDLLYTYNSGVVTFSIDNATPTVVGSAGFTTSGTDTRLGRQFAPYSEFFHGNYDSLRTFEGVATYAEATAPLNASTAPEPQTWAMMLIGFFGMGALIRRRRPDRGRAQPV